MRTRFLLILILASISNSLFAQKAVIDSVQRLLTAHPQQDTIRVNLLHKLFIEIRRVDRTKMQPTVDEELKIAQQLNYQKGLAYAYMDLGAAFQDKYEIKDAYAYYEKSRVILEKLNDKDAMASLLYRRARVYMDDGKHAQSLNDYLQCIKLSEETGDVRLAIDSKSSVGYLYNILGEYAKAIPYYKEALEQSEKLGYKRGMANSLNAMGKTYKTQGTYPEALKAYSDGLKYEISGEGIAVAHGNIGDVYERMGDFKNGFLHTRMYLAYYDTMKKVQDRQAWGIWVLGKTFTHSGNADSGYYYGRKALSLANEVGWRLYLKEINFLIAESAAKLKKWDTAYKYLQQYTYYKDSLVGEDIARKTTMLQASYDLDKKQSEIELQKAENKRERSFLVMVLGGLLSAVVLAFILFRGNRQKQKANLLLQRQKKEIDQKAAELSVQKENLEQSYSNVQLLSEIGRKITSSLSVEKIIGTVYDNVNTLMDASIFGIGIYNEEQKTIDFPATYENGEALPFYSNSIYDENRFGALSFLSGKEIVMGDLQTEYKNFLQQMPTPKEGSQPVSLIYLPLIGKEKNLGVITVQSFEKNAYSEYHLFMLRNIAIYAAIALENADSFEKLNQTLVSLKKTQNQLIQAEKMASLGELTAGIAHEIQNPLNFVNNFSEVSVELANELREEVKQTSIDEKQKEEINNLINDLIQNQDKINFHGKRADAIVKGMLMHSRSSSGQKEPTDLNALADEYLRLSYHGLRAKDKTFNAAFKTDFDAELPKINVVSQDIGRVILNLFTNAFYSVTEKKKQVNGAYEPTVSVSTKMNNGSIELRVRDNGMGIPQKIIDKIYQPFFTTKPGGQGTGLGLSLSYDIITKGHGGLMNVESKEGEFAEFIIKLPAN